MDLEEVMIASRWKLAAHCVCVVTITCSDFDPRNMDGAQGAFRVSSPAGSDSVFASERMVSGLHNWRAVSGR